METASGLFRGSLKWNLGWCQSLCLCWVCVEMFLLRMNCFKENKKRWFHFESQNPQAAKKRNKKLPTFFNEWSHWPVAKNQASEQYWKTTDCGFRRWETFDNFLEKLTRVHSFVVMNPYLWVKLVLQTNLQRVLNYT